MSTTRGAIGPWSFNSYCSTCSGFSPAVISANRLATSSSAFCIAPWASSSPKPCLKPHDQNEMDQRAEARCRGTRSPHIEDGAALNAGAGSNRSFIGCSGKDCHPRESMGQATANAQHRSDDSGKDLSVASELSSRLGDIANAGNAHRLARRSRVEFCLTNPAILEHEPDEILPVHFQCPALVAMRVA